MDTAAINLADAPNARWDTISLPHALASSLTGHALLVFCLCLIPFTDKDERQPAVVSVVFELQQNHTFRATSQPESSVLKTRSSSPTAESDRKLEKSQPLERTHPERKNSAHTPQDIKASPGSPDVEGAADLNLPSELMSFESRLHPDASSVCTQAYPSTVTGSSDATAKSPDNLTKRASDFVPAELTMEEYDMFVSRESLNEPSVVLRVNPILRLALRNNAVMEARIPQMPRIAFTGAVRVHAIDLETVIESMSVSSFNRCSKPGEVDGEALLDADTLKLQALDCSERAKGCEKRGNDEERLYWLRRAAFYRDLQVVTTPHASNKTALNEAMQAASLAHRAAGQDDASAAFEEMMRRFNNANAATRAQCFIIEQEGF